MFKIMSFSAGVLLAGATSGTLKRPFRRTFLSIPRRRFRDVWRRFNATALWRRKRAPLPHRRPCLRKRTIRIPPVSTSCSTRGWPARRTPSQRLFALRT